MSASAAAPPRPLDAGIEQLQAIASSSEPHAVLAQLQVKAFRALRGAPWAHLTSSGARGAPDGPALQGAVIQVNVRRCARLLADLAADLHEVSVPLSVALERGAIVTLDALYAALTFDDERLARAARHADVSAEALAVLCQVGTLPLLLSLPRDHAREADAAPWAAGYCPICGAWPRLAELRGLDREHWLRCGRCAAEWSFPHAVCVFCGSEEHDERGYLAAEVMRESRRAVTCDRCHGYVKTVATLGPLSAAEILAQDLSTLELDVAALDAGYALPSAAGYRLDLRLEPLRARGSWWRGQA